MKQNLDGFVVESTPVLDIKKQGLGTSTAASSTSPGNWDSDRTEVYADVDASEAIASLVADNGETYPITTFPFVMGRGNECDLVLNGKGVSRRHAEIVFQSGRFVVNDLESLNGIKVNGYKIARVILEENDIIKLGEVALTFYSGSNQEESTVDSPKVKKGGSGLFAKREEPKAAADDTFGPSPLKKMLTTTLMMMAVAMLLAAGYLYYTKSNRSGLMVAGSGSGAAPISANANSRTNTPAMSGNVNAARQQAPVREAAPSPDTSTAPPPSISMSGRKPSSSNVTGAEAKVADIAKLAPKQAAIEPAPPEVKKPASKPAPKVVANLNSEASSAVVSAERIYLQGNANGALEQLRPYLNNSAVTGAARTRVVTANQDIGSLTDQFNQAQSAFSQGDKDLAFSLWTDFMAREENLFSGRKSSYTRSITAKVMDEYVARGNEASGNNDYHTAYENWQKALDIGDSVAAKIAIENQNNRARQLYRQALRLEYVNAGKAKDMWREVTQILPPGTEYHTKASAKLAWYDKWGT
ncbi:FHA domain-containing protein [Ketobacter sp.]|nr:MAG: FHA domain-containing protein [Ketobacter sp.]